MRCDAPCREHIYVFRNPSICAGTRCVLRTVAAGPGMARPLHGLAEPFWCGGYGRAGAGGTYKYVPYRVGCRHQNASDKPAPVLHPQIWECPNGCTAPRRGRGHARPVPHWHIWGCSDWCIRRLGNAFMRSGACPFAPESGAFYRPVLPGRAWPVPYRADAAVGVHPMLWTVSALSALRAGTALRR